MKYRIKDHIGIMTVSPFSQGETVELARLVDVTGSSLPFFGIHFKNCLFDSFLFQHCTFDACSFEHCSFTGAFEQSFFTNCKFQDCYFDEVKFSECNMFAVSFVRSKFVYSSFRSLACKELVFDNSELDEIQVTRRTSDMPFEMLANGCIIWKCSPELVEAGKGKSAILPYNHAQN